MKVPFPASCAPPFPYSGPWEPSEDHQRDLLALQESLIPEATLVEWKREGIPGDDRSVWEWVHWVPRIPVAAEDQAWGMEHASHILGEPVPLLSGQDLLILTAGGLLLVWDTVAFDLYIVRPGVSLEDLLEQISTRPGLPARLARIDNIADSWSYIECWNSEVRETAQREKLPYLRHGIIGHPWTTQRNWAKRRLQFLKSRADKTG